jgi:hypothetical protein
LFNLLCFTLTQFDRAGASGNEHCTADDHSSAHTPAHPAMPPHNHPSSWASSGAAYSASSSHDFSPFFCLYVGRLQIYIECMLTKSIMT